MDKKYNRPVLVDSKILKNILIDQIGGNNKNYLDNIKKFFKNNLKLIVILGIFIIFLYYRYKIENERRLKIEEEIKKKAEEEKAKQEKEFLDNESVLEVDIEEPKELISN